jgi:hypothetical protein
MRVEIRGFKCDLTSEEEADLREQLGGRPRGVISANNSDEEGMLSTAALAKRLNVSPDFIYAHAQEYGGVKIGNGPKAHWRFPVPLRGDEASSQQQATRPDPRTRPRTRRATANVPLLAVRGDAPYAAPNEKRPPSSALTPSEGLDSGGGSSNAHD